MKNRIIALVIVLVLALMPMAQAATYDVASLTIENPTVSMYGEETEYPVSASVKIGMDEETGAYVGNLAAEFNGAPINAALAFDGSALYANVDGMQNLLTVDMATVTELIGQYFTAAMAEEGIALDEASINALIEMFTPFINAVMSAAELFSDEEKTGALLATVTEMVAGWITTYEDTVDFNTEYTAVPVTVTRVEFTLEDLMTVISTLTTADADIAAAIANVLTEAETLLVSLSGDESMVGMAQQIQAILAQPEAFAEMEIRFVEETYTNDEVGIYAVFGLEEAGNLVSSEAFQMIYTEAGFNGYYYMNGGEGSEVEIDYQYELIDNGMDIYAFIDVNEVNVAYIDLKMTNVDGETDVSLYITNENDTEDCYLLAYIADDGSLTGLYVNTETYDEEGNSLSCDEYDISLSLGENGYLFEIYNESKGAYDFGDGDVWPYDDITIVDISFLPEATENGIAVPALIEFMSYSVPEDENTELTDADVLYASIPVTVELYSAEDALYLPSGELFDIIAAMNDEEAMNALSADLMQAIAPFLSATGLMGEEVG